MEAPNPPSRPSKFTNFSLLPTELRLQIFSLAANVPRALELEYCMVDHQFFVFQHVPSILHTSRESREVGLSHYHLSFGTPRHPAGTYFNPSYDIVYFGTRQYPIDISFMVRHFFEVATTLEPRDQIQRLGIAEHLWAVDDNTTSAVFSIRRRGQLTQYPRVPSFLAAFPKLKQLIFVCRPKDEPDWESDIEEKWEDYSGVSLIKSVRPQDEHDSFLKDERLILRKFDSYLIGRKTTTPEDSGPEIEFMEYGFAR